MGFVINYAPVESSGRLAWAGGYGRRRNELQDSALQRAFSAAQQQRQIEASRQSQMAALEAQSASQLRSQDFARQQMQDKYSMDLDRYGIEQADREQQLADERAWRESVAQQTRQQQQQDAKAAAKRQFDYQQQAADEASKRAVQGELDLRSQKANQIEKETRAKLAPLIAEKNSRSVGGHGAIPDIQILNDAQLDDAIGQLTATLYGVKDLVKPPQITDVGNGVMAVQGSGVQLAYPSRRNAGAQEKPLGEAYWQKRVERHAADLMKQGKPFSEAFDEAQQMAGEERRVYEENTNPELKARREQTDAASAMGMARSWFGGSQPQQIQQAQQSGQAPVTTSAAGVSSAVGGSGKPMDEENVGMTPDGKLSVSFNDATTAAFDEDAKNVPVIQSKEAALALPSGTIFRTPEGKLKRRP